jgi:hypothetical protein
MISELPLGLFSDVAPSTLVKSQSELTQSTTVPSSYSIAGEAKVLRQPMDVLVQLEQNVPPPHKVSMMDKWANSVQGKPEIAKYCGKD